MHSRDWYQGTADAVRQNLARISYSGAREVLILSGDQLYAMRVRDFVRSHREREADISIAVKPVGREEARGLGIMQTDDDGRIVRFVEKPQEDEVLDELMVEPESLARLGFEAEEPALLASMGIYIFRTGVLKETLTGTEATDFGREVIPQAIEDYAVYAFGYDGYWRDIGTIPAFHQANLELTLPVPPLNLYDVEFPVFTHPRFLPGTKINHCEVQQSILCEGSIISGSRIAASIVGLRAIVRPGSVIERSILMGANSFEVADPKRGSLPVGVGRDCVIRNAILDTNCRIGEGCQLTNERGVEDEDGDFYSIKGGVIVIPRGAEVPPGTVL